MTAIVVISGTVGSGKSTVAASLHDLMVARGFSCAVIDVDWLCQYDPAPLDDPHNDRLAFANLAALWPNYQALELDYLVLARVVETPGDRERYEAAFGQPVFIVLLEAATEERVRRLVDREDDERWREWHLNRTEELAETLREVALHDVMVRNDGRRPVDTAKQIAAILPKP